tara:strand:+ start:2244 stop:2633 length:390 start_codon:yes stop_codon:yes gene_type:complete
MEIIKFLHHSSAIIFLLNSLLLSGFYFIIKDKSSPLIKGMAKIEWFLSSLLFFLGMLLIFFSPFWFQIGIFHFKVAIGMLAIGGSHYFYKQFEIATKENNYTKLLIQMRIFIPLLILTTNYSGSLLFTN